MKVYICIKKIQALFFQGLRTYFKYYHVCVVVVVVVLVAAQNDSASGWEPKVVEFFKNKLKEKNIHALVK